MKSILTVLIAVVMSVTLYGQNPRLTATTMGRNTLYLEVDRQIYTITRDAFEIDGLRPGHHDIKIYRQIPVEVHRLGRGGTVRVTDGELLFSRRINLKDDYHLDIVVNRFGKVLVDERRIDRNDDWYGNDWTVTELDSNYTPSVMSKSDFEEALAAIKHQNFQASMLQSAKLIIDSNYFKSEQVKRILDLFWTGTSKVELAKYAYAHTVDKGKYFKVIQNLSHWDQRYVQDYIASYGKDTEEPPKG